MRLSQVRKRWAENKPVLATVAHFTDPQSAELIGIMGIDCLWIDLEHQPIGMGEFEEMVRASRVSNMDVMARPAKGEFMRAVRLIEAGAMVLMYPRCESAAEATELVQACKFPPLGHRGFFSASPDNPYCLTSPAEYVRQANEQTVLLAQIESPNAVSHARRIAEVEGIDMLFFGPGDFSLMAGVPGQLDHPMVQAGMVATAQHALESGKRFGTLVTNLDQARRALDIGASMLTYGGDLHFVRAALVNIKEQFASLGFEFNPILHGGSSASENSNQGGGGV